MIYCVIGHNVDLKQKILVISIKSQSERNNGIFICVHTIMPLLLIKITFDYIFNFLLA